MRGDLEQGQIVKVEDRELFLNCPCVLVVTHSCDIINTKEPFIEVLACLPILPADPSRLCERIFEKNLAFAGSSKTLRASVAPGMAVSGQFIRPKGNHHL